jgi:hypothetical protein
VSALDENARERRADEAGPAENENMHPRPPV